MCYEDKQALKCKMKELFPLILVDIFPFEAERLDFSIYWSLHFRSELMQTGHEFFVLFKTPI